MCTVTAFLDNQKFILTSNRDIPTDRVHSTPPEKIKYNRCSIISPIDPEGKGTWIGASKYLIASLLNNKGPENSDLDSRGILVYNILSMKLSSKNLKDESKFFNPYVLILFDIRSRELREYSWDGITFEESKITSPFNIWTSNTIYSKEESSDKEKIFLNTCSDKSTSKDILNFHLKSENILNSNIKTTSITQVNYQSKSNIKYYDLINRQNHISKLLI